MADASENGCAQFILDYRVFEQLFQLSPDVRIRGIYWDAAWAAWRVHLEGPGLPSCEQGMMPKVLEQVTRWHRVAPHEFVTTHDYMLGDERVAHIGWEHDVGNNPDVEVIQEQHGS